MGGLFTGIVLVLACIFGIVCVGFAFALIGFSFYMLYSATKLIIKRIW